MGSYEQIAVWYDEWLRAGAATHDFIATKLIELVGDVHGQRICDLACGQGVIARQLVSKGAEITGIDVADTLLLIAQREEKQHPLGIVYKRDDAQTLTTLENASYDGVVCNLALMDIPDIHATFQNVHRILRSHGWFAFSMTHPCFEAPNSRWMQTEHGKVSREVRGYFTEGFWRSDNLNGVRGRIGAYHRTLSTYVNALVSVGFSIERMSEPLASYEMIEAIPGYKEVPPALLMLCRKLSEQRE